MFKGLLKRYHEKKEIRLEKYNLRILDVYSIAPCLATSQREMLERYRRYNFK